MDPHDQNPRHMGEGRENQYSGQNRFTPHEYIPVKSSVTAISSGNPATPFVSTAGSRPPVSPPYAGISGDHREHARRPISPTQGQTTPGMSGDHRGHAHRPISPAQGQMTAADLVRQKDSEIHLLRMTVTDKDVHLGRFTRDLDHCHHQIKHLNTLLTEKKESILGYQEQIAGMRSELAQLRDAAMCGVEKRESRSSGTSTQAERALQMQVEQLSRQNSDLYRQLEDQRRRGEAPPQDGRGRTYRDTGGDQSELGNLHVQRDQARMELDTVRRQSGDMKTRVEMLEVQVSIYKEDFHSERSDRERAQAELLTLKEEGDNLRQAINMLATEHGIQLGPTGLPLPPHN